jgi:hypothetical protein
VARKGELTPDRHRIYFMTGAPRDQTSLTLHLVTMRSQFLYMLAHIAVERGDLRVALDFAHRAVPKTREEIATKAVGLDVLIEALRTEAHILESLGRFDEAFALDEEFFALKPTDFSPDPPGAVGALGHQVRGPGGGLGCRGDFEESPG